MSICIASITPDGAVLGVDSKYTSTDGTQSGTGMEKSLIRNFHGRPIVVGFAGDSKIGDSLVKDILISVKDEGEPLKAFQAAILGAYKEDVENYAWESEDDKNEFVEKASVYLVCLDSPTSYGVTQIGVTHVKREKSGNAPNWLGFGVQNVGNRLFETRSIAQAVEMVTNVIGDLCHEEPSCGLPARLIVWKNNGHPQRSDWFETQKTLRSAYVAEGGEEWAQS